MPLHILTLALCYAVPAIGLNLLFGYTGLVSLGHMGFAGVGAYTTALLMKNGIVGFCPGAAGGRDRRRDGRGCWSALLAFACAATSSSS